MFQSYQLLNCLGHNPDTNQYRYKYQIIDSDFEEIVVGAKVADTIIDTYEKRTLPVHINLALFFKYLHVHCAEDFEYIISMNRTYNPKYLPYAEETEKCLQRIINMKTFW